MADSSQSSKMVSSTKRPEIHTTISSSETSYSNNLSEKCSVPVPDLGNCLVIGGCGLLGRAIVYHLERQGYSVKIMDIQNSTNHPNYHFGDITQSEDLETLCQDVDTVFQTAAAVWDPELEHEKYFQVNVAGNQNVIDVCQKYQIPRLIYTSTMDVVVSDERRAYTNIDESTPYPAPLPKDPYSRSKIQAEQLVLEANGDHGMHTCALRPVGIYGPGDKYHLGNFIKMAKKGNKFRLGDGTAKFSHIYSENAAWAHILAAHHLSPTSVVAGNVYFLTDYPAENIFDFLTPFLKEFNLCIPKRKIPYRLAYGLATLCEKLNPKSTFNRFSVMQTCLDHTYCGKQAQIDFGYSPIVSQQEAFQKTVTWFKNEFNFS